MAANGASVAFTLLPIAAGALKPRRASSAAVATLPQRYTAWRVGENVDGY